MARGMRTQNQKTQRMGIKKADTYAKQLVRNLTRDAVSKKALAIKIQDHELRQIGMTREKFTRLSPTLQKQIKDFLEREEEGKAEEEKAAVNVEIQDRELKYLGMCREDFEKLSPWNQQCIKGLLEEDLQQQKEDKKKQLHTEASNEQGN